jgi:hypothetical protein
VEDFETVEPLRVSAEDTAFVVEQEDDLLAGSAGDDLLPHQAAELSPMNSIRWDPELAAANFEAGVEPGLRLPEETAPRTERLATIHETAGGVEVLGAPESQPITIALEPTESKPWEQPEFNPRIERGA